MCKSKKKVFGHSEIELWNINHVGCHFLNKLGSKVGFCANRWNSLNNAQRKHAPCKYALCPLRQEVICEEFKHEEDEE